MKVTITEAAKLAGLSRSYFHMKYIKMGKISITRDDNNKPFVDTSELLRVFPVLENNKQVDAESKHEITPIENAERVALQAENNFLRKQLTLAQDRERWLQHTVDKLADQLKLLEHKPEPTRSFFSRLFGK